MTLLSRAREDGGLVAYALWFASNATPLSNPLEKRPGNLGVKCLGRASCACRCIRDTVAAEWLWTALWEGPLPDGFSNGGKAAHAALWLLAKGQVEQVGMLLRV